MSHSKTEVENNNSSVLSLRRWHKSDMTNQVHETDCISDKDSHKAKYGMKRENLLILNFTEVLGIR